MPNIIELYNIAKNKTLDWIENQTDDNVDIMLQAFLMIKAAPSTTDNIPIINLTDWTNLVIQQSKAWKDYLNNDTAVHKEDFNIIQQCLGSWFLKRFENTPSSISNMINIQLALSFYNNAMLCDEQDLENLSQLALIYKHMGRFIKPQNFNAKVIAYSEKEALKQSFLRLNMPPASPQACLLESLSSTIKTDVPPIPKPALPEEPLYRLTV
jgi:hypothetical protein